MRDACQIVTLLVPIARAIIVRDPNGPYLPLLLEARELFVDGRYYSCVAMCGIVGERLLKDLLRAVIHVEIARQIARPSTDAFDQFERTETSTLARFLHKAGLLAAESAKASDQLAQLRNQYAHARGAGKAEDAVEAVRLLHVLVEATVSVFKDFELRDGAFVPRNRQSSSS